MQYESSLFFTFFQKDRDAQARETVKIPKKWLDLYTLLCVNFRLS